MRSAFSMRPTAHRLGDELVAEIIKSERAAMDFPQNVADADKFLVDVGAEPAKRSFAGGGFPFAMGEDFHDDDEDDEDEFEEDEDEDEDEFSFFEFGAGASPKDGPIGESPTLQALLDQFGGDVSPQKLFADHPELAVKIFREMGLDGVDPQIIQDMFKTMSGFSPGGKGKKRNR